MTILKHLNKKQRRQVELLRKENKIHDARTLLIQICQQTPANIDAWLLLGELSIEVNDFNNAVSCFTKALQLDSNNTRAIKNLASIYLTLARNHKGNNDHKNASVMYKNALRLDKKNTQTWTEYGVMLSEVQDFQSAINVFKRVAKLLPKQAASYSNLGVAYQKSGNIAFAAEPYKKAVELEPHNVDYILNHVHVLIVYGEFDKAEKLLAPVLKKNPDNERALVELLKIYTNTNRQDEAIEIVTPFIQGDLDNVSPVLMACYLEACKNTPNLEQAVQLSEKLISKTTAKNEDLYGLFFQLGAYYDKSGDYEKAYNFFEKGNQLRDERDDIFEKQIKTLEQNVSSLTSSVFSDAASSDNMSELPVFVVGMPRSGTSLVEQILDRHPDIYGIGENNLINQYLLDYIRHKPYLEKFSDCFAAFTQQELHEISSDYCNKIIQETDGKPYKRIINKMPDNFRLIPFIRMLFPNARIIHCARNPLDTCLSIYFQIFSGLHYYAYNQRKLARYYNLYQSLMKHYTETLNIEVMNIQYEELVSDQELWSKQLIEYCGLEWNDACLDFHKSDRHVRTASKDQVNKPIYTSSVNRWKNYEKYITPLMKSLEQ